MSGVFISYRRDDSAGYAGRLYDLLCERLGQEQVFMDIDTIRPGENFAELIERTCENCDVVIAVIGKSWASAMNKEGKRRLDDPDDFVRLEISRALAKGIRTIPVLVGGAAMPVPETLPPELRKLSSMETWQLKERSFREDATRLVDVLLASPARITAARPPVTSRPQLLIERARSYSILPKEDLLRLRKAAIEGADFETEQQIRLAIFLRAERNSRKIRKVIGALFGVTVVLIAIGGRGSNLAVVGILLFSLACVLGSSGLVPWIALKRVMRRVESGKLVWEPSEGIYRYL